MRQSFVINAIVLMLDSVASVGVETTNNGVNFDSIHDLLDGDDSATAAAFAELCANRAVLIKRYRGQPAVLERIKHLLAYTPQRALVALRYGELFTEDIVHAIVADTHDTAQAIEAHGLRREWSTAKRLLRVGNKPEHLSAVIAIEEGLREIADAA